jgi:hypothetical protein
MHGVRGTIAATLVVTAISVAAAWSVTPAAARPTTSEWGGHSLAVWVRAGDVAPI